MLRRFLGVVLLVLLATAARAQQQDDPFETHLYNVEFLTVSVADHPGEDLGLVQDAIGTAVAASEFSSSLLTGEDLAVLIKTNVAEDSWEHVNAGILYTNGALTITNRKSVHEKVVKYLDYWRGFLGRMVVVDAAVVSIDPQLLAKIRSAGNADRPAILPPDQYKQVLDAAREGKLAEIARSARVTAHPGQRVNLGEFTRQDYIRDYDVQIATAAVAMDPILDVLSTGFRVDVRPYVEPFADGITLEVRADLSDQEALENRKLRLTKDLFGGEALQGEKGPVGQPRGPAISIPVEHNLQLPRLTLDRLRTTLTVKNRETAIVGSVFRKGRNLLFLLTPAIVSADDKPAPEPTFEEQRLVRLFDISPLTRGIQDFAGPKMDVVAASRGAGGPLTGATFTLDEPAILMSAEDVTSMIRTRVAPDSWENSRNSIGTAAGSTLVVRQKPEVLKEIEKFLGTLLTARAQMITTETIVVGFKKGARFEWEKQIPALAPGGYFVEQALFDKLLEEAYKGQNVRLVEMSEITAFPQQRVHTMRSLQEAQLAKYEPQVSTMASMYDPIIGVFTTGFVLDVRSHFVHGQEQIAVDFRSQMCAGQLKDLDLGVANVGPLQAAQARVLKWASNVRCVKGKWSLVALETIGKGADAEDWAIFVRARQNILK